MRVYQCDCCNKVISNPYTVKMKVNKTSWTVLTTEKSRKGRNDYISWGMLRAYGIVADYLGDLEVLE